MSPPYTYVGWVRLFHFLGLAIWIGTLFSAVRLVLAATRTEEKVAREALLAAAHRSDGIARVGAALTLVTGLLIFVTLLEHALYLQQGWMHVKLLFVVMLLVVQILLTYRISVALRSGDPGAPRFYQLVNLAGGISVFVVLLVVVLKPWASYV